MSSLSEIKKNREQKLQKLVSAGQNPYSAITNETHTLDEVNKNFKENEEVTLIGRIMSIRGQGAIMFIPLFDGTSRFQTVLKKDEIDENSFNLFNETIDIGDFIETTGTLFVTQRGENSLLIKSWRIITKTLLPLPEKWSGLKDIDERYRKRYLDLLMNDEEREVIIKKSKFWQVARDFMLKKGFLEVETPTLETTTGGAEANPFKTFHQDFNLDVYLRISVGELWQKRLLAGGFPKTFEIGRVYRNEGSSPEHTQEFTNLEFYQAFADYKDGMELVKELYRHLAKEVFGTTKFTTRGHTFDLSDDWPEIDYQQTVLEKTGIDILKDKEADMDKKLKELNIKFSGNNRERKIDSLWKYCRKQISGPAFLVHHPKIVSPLSKPLEDNPKLTQRFQPIIAGSELGNGFSELNDPHEQRERFQEQNALIEAGDKEAMMPDWEYVEMLEHGMPPACGYGFGERLFAFLVDRPVRETQTFPLVKPKDN